MLTLPRKLSSTLECVYEWGLFRQIGTYARDHFRIYL